MNEAVPNFEIQSDLQAAKAPQIVTVNLSDVRFVEDVYPRIKPNPAKIQEYAENLDKLPPIEVNQDCILIDGFHRWTAHRKAERATIRAFVTQTNSDRELHRLAMERNNRHGMQVTMDDKRRYVVSYYDGGNKKELAEEVSVSERTIANWVVDKDRQIREERKALIADLWLSCHTQEEIAAAVGITRDQVQKQSEELWNLENFPNSTKVNALFQNEGFSPPLYNVWAYGKVTNKVGHFGNSEQRIVENLLYLYTEPFDIVLDPFAGGGSTIDVCQHRLRRYWVSDRKPIVERENEIRKLDIAQELPPLNKRWSEVTLTYLDPPYWKQAEGRYSDDAEDLANMSLEHFTKTLAAIVNRIAAKQSRGVIALLLQPTQWKAEEREFTDHVMQVLCAVDNKRLRLENRVSCPYSTEQCTPQQVEWAKANRKLLVISRELLIWRLVA